MSTKTQIANKTFVNIGEMIVSDIDTDTNTPADEFNALWNSTLEDLLTTGPEEGYAFSKWSTSQVDVDSTSIMAFANHSGTVSGTVLATDTGHKYLTGDTITIKDGSIGAYDGDVNITKVDVNSYYFTATFSATETATAQWTSQKFNFRYTRPASLQITKVCDGGIELTDWTRRRDWILTNFSSDNVEMDYILAVTDLTVTSFPAWFVEVVWRKMAIAMSYSRVQRLAMRDRFEQELEQIYLPRAIGMDAREQFVEEQGDEWQAAGRTTTFLE